MTRLAACAHTINAGKKEKLTKSSRFKIERRNLPFIGLLIRGFLLSVGTLKKHEIETAEMKTIIQFRFLLKD